jgi:hypothetical protein
MATDGDGPASRAAPLRTHAVLMSVARRHSAPCNPWSSNSRLLLKSWACWPLRPSIRRLSNFCDRRSKFAFLRVRTRDGPRIVRIASFRSLSQRINSLFARRSSHGLVLCVSAGSHRPRRCQAQTARTAADHENRASYDAEAKSRRGETAEHESSKATSAPLREGRAQSMVSHCSRLVTEYWARGGYRSPRPSTRTGQTAGQ